MLCFIFFYHLRYFYLYVWKQNNGGWHSIGVVDERLQHLLHKIVSLRIAMYLLWIAGYWEEIVLVGKIGEEWVGGAECWDEVEGGKI